MPQQCHRLHELTNVFLKENLYSRPKNGGQIAEGFLVPNVITELLRKLVALVYGVQLM